MQNNSTETNEKKSSILIIDDDESTRKSLMLIFRKKGYEIETVGSGREGLEKTKEKYFNLVLVDIKLPDMEGIDLIEPLKEIHPDTAVIMVTAFASMETVMQALNLGASAYITKPLNMEEVFVTVRENLEKQTLMAENKRLFNALSDSEKSYRTLFEESRDAINMYTREGDYIYGNQSMLDLFGYTENEMKSLKADQLYVNQEDRNRFRQELEKKGYVKDFEVKMRKKNGVEMDCLITSTIHRDDKGNILRFQSFIFDITERKRVEEEKTRTQVMNRFISTITHELRTPLVSIDGYLDYINTGKLGPVPKKIESSLKVVRQESARLLSLTNDLLDIRRLEFGTFQLNQEPLNYREVIDHCTREIHPFIREKKQQFKVDVPEEPLMVNGDRIRLCQSLMNLLSNATKFTAEKGEIILHVETDADNITTQVSDTGIGIREEDLERIFESFAAIKKPTYIKGTGLGLSVTKGLVEAHKGKIWAESEGEGKGAKLTFTIPKNKKK
jgi:two-component system phosphate regulon sensor histidine kinase PhoR